MTNFYRQACGGGMAGFSTGLIASFANKNRTTSSINKPRALQMPRAGGVPRRHASFDFTPNLVFSQIDIVDYDIFVNSFINACNHTLVKWERQE